MPPHLHVLSLTAPQPRGGPTSWSNFIKQTRSEVKQAKGEGASHGEIMREIGDRWTAMSDAGELLGGNVGARGAGVKGGRGWGAVKG